MTSALLRGLGAAVLILPLLIYGGWHYRRAQLQYQTQQAEYEQAQDFLRRLEKPVHLAFPQPVTLGEWLQEWSRQTGIPVTTLAPQESAFSAPAYTQHYESPDAKRMVTLELPATSAREALLALAEIHGLQWEPMNQTIVVHFRNRWEQTAPDPSEVVRHSLPISLSRSPHETLEPLIDNRQPNNKQIAFLGSGFQRVTMPVVQSHLFHHPDQLIFVQPAPAQLLVSDLLRTLQLAIERTESLPKFPSPDDPRLQPLLLSHGPRNLDILARFSQPVTVVAKDLPLPQFTDELTRQTGVPFYISTENLRNHGREPQTPITCELQHMRLQAVLPRTLARRNFSYRLLALSDQVVIDDVGERYSEDHRCTVAYPIADLLTAGQERHLIGDLYAIVASEPRYSHEEIELRLFQNLLIARMGLNEHWVLHDLLTAVRNVRSGLAQSRMRADVPGEHVDGLVTEVFDLRPFRQFGPHCVSAVARMLRCLEADQVFDRRDVDGNTAIIKDTLVMRNSPAVVQQAWNLLEFIRVDLQTGHPIWPGRGELPDDALNEPILTADPLERNPDRPRRLLYFVGDLLAPRGPFARGDLLERCGLLDDRTLQPRDPFADPRPAAGICADRILVARLTIPEHEQLRDTFRALREEARK